MPEYMSTLLAALIGAVIGSVGAVFAEYWLTRRTEESQRRQMMSQRYLFQFQDAVEALWYRLNNLTFMGGRFVMPDDYFETTTLYALGRVLANERILALEGVYPQLDSAYPDLGKFLRERRIDRELQSINFHQYDRISLAEAVIEREAERYRTSTYLEFRRRFEAEGSTERKWLAPAREAIQSLDEKSMKALLDSLRAIAVRIANETGVSSSLVVSA